METSTIIRMVHHGMDSWSKRRKKFMKKRPVPKTEATTVYHRLMANGPMICLSDTNLMSGTSAKGS